MQPHLLSDSLLDSLMNIAIKYRDRVDPTIMLPQVNWREPKNDRRDSNQHCQPEYSAGAMQVASQAVREKKSWRTRKL